MMNEEAIENEGVEEDDPCLSFVSNIVLKTMKMKHEKWVKMMTTDEYKVSAKLMFIRNLISLN